MSGGGGVGGRGVQRWSEVKARRTTEARWRLLGTFVAPPILAHAGQESSGEGSFGLSLL